MPELLSYLTGDKITAAVLCIVAIFYLVKFILNMRKELHEAHAGREAEHEKCCRYRVKLEKARGQITLLRYLCQESGEKIDAQLPDIPDLPEHQEVA